MNGRRKMAKLHKVVEKVSFVLRGSWLTLLTILTCPLPTAGITNRDCEHYCAGTYSGSTSEEECLRQVCDCSTNPGRLPTSYSCSTGDPKAAALGIGIIALIVVCSLCVPSIVICIVIYCIRSRRTRQQIYQGGGYVGAPVQTPMVVGGGGAYGGGIDQSGAQYNTMQGQQPYQAY